MKFKRRFCVPENDSEVSVVLEEPNCGQEASQRFWQWLNPGVWRTGCRDEVQHNHDPLSL